MECFFFFKQKTAYEMRISDWSSDVCSSDLVFGTVGIDMIAGPSEILIICDGSTPADWIAMDLFSQAEHDELAQAILLCPDASYLDQVEAAIERLLPTMPRADIIQIGRAHV